MRPEVSVIKEREPVPTPKRRRLSKKEIASLMLSQDGRCGCGCGRKLEAGNFIGEHVIPLAAGGQSKPDALYHKDCARRKTRGDIKTIAKIRRLQRKTGRHSGRKVARIKSRGFDRRWRKKMNGEVERRD